ncbi:hypothetical protein ACQ29_gp375 [Escherichia phage PBECO4]|nr:hypothetical protein ACQ29_gp375 [Escherichia phage PBECO4]AGC35055.1 hypothetical protein [Escherichia phage PBECO4]WPK18633.1 hypothetical protein [Salmonella phage SD-2_S15]WPK19285.1 hypothetical protein [Salmonella phage SD-6_S16]WPK20976.1 hypothetical protein [Salmonella phage SD-15_S21]
MEYLRFHETYEAGIKMSNILNEKTVDVVIGVLNTATSFQKKHSVVYFGEDCWLNYTNNSFIIRVEADDIGLTVQVGCAKTDKQITVIVDKLTSSFYDSIDDCEHYSSTFYDTEEEHFMESTVQELAIPYKLMKAVSDLILKYKKIGVTNAI